MGKNDGFSGFIYSGDYLRGIIFVVLFFFYWYFFINCFLDDLIGSDCSFCGDLGKLCKVYGVRFLIIVVVMCLL